MPFFGISALFNLPGDAPAKQPEGHDDLRAAVVAQGQGKGRRWFALFSPARFQAAAERRLASRLREEGLARLAETSPHLLADVGMAPARLPTRVADHNAHLADDIAISPEDVMTVHSMAAASAQPLRAREPGAGGTTVQQ